MKLSSVQTTISVKRVLATKCCGQILPKAGSYQKLHLMLAAFAMAMSSMTVVTNSLQLYKAKIY